MCWLQLLKLIGDVQVLRLSAGDDRECLVADGGEKTGELRAKDCVVVAAVIFDESAAIRRTWSAITRPPSARRSAVVVPAATFSYDTSRFAIRYEKN